MRDLKKFRALLARPRTITALMQRLARSRAAVYGHLRACPDAVNVAWPYRPACWWVPDGEPYVTLIQCAAVATEDTWEEGARQLGASRVILPNGEVVMI
jgi:hypothetical protein